MVVSDPIASLVRRWLPGKDLEITRARSGGSTEVYRVRLGRETFWLRLAEDAGEDRTVEYVVHDRLRAIGARVPDVVIFDVAPPELDRSVALTSHIAGVPLTECRDAAIAQSVARAAAEDLVRINTIPVSGFGWIDRIGDDIEIVAEHPDRSRWVTEYTQAVRKVAAANVLSRSVVGEINPVIAEWAGIGADAGASVPVSCLAHGDFDTTHIYHDPETSDYTGIIDFGEARGADPGYDPGHLLLHDGEGDRPAIYESVREVFASTIGDAISDRRAHLQAVAIGTRQLAKMLERGQSPYRDWLVRRLSELSSSDALRR